MDKRSNPPAYSQQPPPPAGFIQPTVILQQPHGNQNNYGPTPQTIYCNHCATSITTKVENEANSRTHIAALIICCFLCWPCVCVPYCMDSCQNQNHYCPKCNQFLGSYEH